MRGKGRAAPIDLVQTGRRVEHHVPGGCTCRAWGMTGTSQSRQRREAAGACSAFGRARARPYGASRWNRPRHRRRQPETAPMAATHRSVLPHPPASASSARSATCSDCAAGTADTRPWLDHGRGASAIRWEQQRPAPAGASLRVPARRGREPAPDPGRAGACRHHRAGAFPLHRERRNGRAAGGAARLRAQGHRGPDGGRRPSIAAAQACRPHLRRQHGRLCARLCARGRSGARRRGAAARASGCAR